MSRCVHCDRPKDAHAGEDLRCLNLKTTFGSMDLPAGKHCSDCIHVRFCSQYIGPDIPKNTQCDWFPIRFVCKSEFGG